MKLCTNYELRTNHIQRRHKSGELIILTVNLKLKFQWSFSLTSYDLDVRHRKTLLIHNVTSSRNWWSPSDIQKQKD